MHCGIRFNKWFTYTVQLLFPRKKKITYLLLISSLICLVVFSILLEKPVLKKNIDSATRYDFIIVFYL